MHRLPSFLLRGDYHIVRDGVLPLLRLRKPRNSDETWMCVRALSSAPDTEGEGQPAGTMLLRDVGMTSAGKQWSAKTVFMTGAAKDLQTGAQTTSPQNWEAIVHETGIASLSVGILQNLTEVDYWDSDTSDFLPVEVGDMEYDFEEDENFQVESGLRPHELIPTLSEVFAKTHRLSFESDVLGRFTQKSDVASALVSIFEERDRSLLEGPLGLKIGRNAAASPETRIRQIGRLMHERYAILLIVLKEEDDTIMSISISCSGATADDASGCLMNPSFDTCVRLLLSSWTTPLILQGMDLYRPKFDGVEREKLRLSGKTVLEHSPLGNTMLASQADVAALKKDLLQRLDSIAKSSVQPAVAVRHVERVDSPAIAKLRKLRGAMEERVRKKRAERAERP